MKEHIAKGTSMSSAIRIPMLEYTKRVKLGELWAPNIIGLRIIVEI